MIVGVLADADVGDLAEAHVAAVGPVDEQVAHRRLARGELRVALDHDVEDLLLLEGAADEDALQQDRLGAAHVAGLDAVAPRAIEVDLDAQRRLLPSGARSSRRRRRRRRP